MIPPKANLMEIALQMLLTHIVKNSKFCALQICVKRFGSVVVRIATGIFSFTMIDPVVGSEHLTNSAIGLKLIGHKMRLPINKAFDVRQKIGQFVTINRYGPNRAVALNGNQNSLLLGSSASFVSNSLLVSRLTANVFFVKLNNTLQSWNKLRTRIHHLSDRMPEFPGAFLRNADPFPQENGGYSFA